MNSTLLIIFVALLIAFVILAMCWKLIYRLILRLPQIERFIPKASPVKVRTAAVFIGIVLWTGLGASLFIASNWHTLRPEFISIPTAKGDLVPPFVRSSQAREAIAAMRDLTADQDARFDSEDYATAARERGFFRLDDLPGITASHIGDKLVFLQANDGIVPAFRLTQRLSFIDQPVWRGWLSRALKKDGDPLLLQATLWCGFDLTTQEPARFCVAGLPVPLVVRLFADAKTGGLPKELTLSAPTVLLRLDAQGARVIGTQNAHSRFETRRKTKTELSDLGLTLKIQRKENGLTWSELLDDTLTVTITSSDVPQIAAHQWLWSKRALKGEDRWLFSSRDDGMPNLTRHVHAPRIWQIAHDFLKPSETARAPVDLKDWMFALLFVTATRQFEDDTPMECRKVMREFAQDHSLSTAYEDVQIQKPRNHQAVLLDQTPCPSEMLPLLLNH